MHLDFKLQKLDSSIKELIEKVEDIKLIPEPSRPAGF